MNETAAVNSAVIAQQGVVAAPGANPVLQVIRTELRRYGEASLLRPISVDEVPVDFDAEARGIIDVHFAISHPRPVFVNARS